MATASFKVSNVKLNSQSQTSGSLSGQTVNTAMVQQIVGYAPTEFASITNGTTVQLKTAPGLAQGATTQPTDLRLPVGAIPLKVIITNNGTPLGAGAAPTFIIGTAARQTASTGTARLCTASTRAGINQGLFLLNKAQDSVQQLGNGACTGLIAQPNAVGTANFVTCVCAAADMTPATGDLKIIIEYM